MKALCPPETGDQVNPLVAATKTGPSNVSKRSPVGAVGLWSGGGSVTLTPTSWDEAERWCLVGKGRIQRDNCTAEKVTTSSTKEGLVF